MSNIKRGILLKTIQFYRITSNLTYSDSDFVNYYVCKKQLS